MWCILMYRKYIFNAISMRSLEVCKHICVKRRQQDYKITHKDTVSETAIAQERFLIPTRKNRADAKAEGSHLHPDSQARGGLEQFIDVFDDWRGKQERTCYTAPIVTFRRRLTVGEPPISKLAASSLRVRENTPWESGMTRIPTRPYIPIGRSPRLSCHPCNSYK